MPYIFFFIHSFFTIWVMFFGGADELEGGSQSAFFVSPLAHLLTAPIIKMIVAFTWFVQLLLLVVQLTSN
jgi:hypothetical protein